MMFFRQSYSTAAMCLGLLLAATTVSAASMSVSDKVRLQATMQQHIDQTLVDGAYLHLDFETGDVEKLYPTEAHPMILKLGSVFVLCSNFVRKKGDSVNVDFYLAPHGEAYVVFRAEIENRKPLAQLMKAGKAKRID